MSYVDGAALDGLRGCGDRASGRLTSYAVPYRGGSVTRRAGFFASCVEYGIGSILRTTAAGSGDAANCGTGTALQLRLPTRATTGLAIGDDERLFVTQNVERLHAVMYELAAGTTLTRAGTSVSLLSLSERVGSQPPVPFEFSSARPGSAAVDVFGTDVAVGFEISQSEADVLANGQTDRFGNRLPLFGAPNGLVASPDGRHVYLSSYQHGVVAFERVGAGVEPEDPYARLDILEVSSGTISFGAEMDSDGCVAVDGLEHGGVAYTVRKLQMAMAPERGLALDRCGGDREDRRTLPAHAGRAWPLPFGGRDAGRWRDDGSTPATFSWRTITATRSTKPQRSSACLP